MPTKPNKAGNQQDYVPAGNGDASGEYADGEGQNIHYFTKFKKPKGEVKIKTKEDEYYEKLTQDMVKLGYKQEEIDNWIEKDKKDQLLKKQQKEQEELLADVDMEEKQEPKEEISIDFKEEKEPENKEVKKFIKENKNAIKELGVEKVKDILLNTYSEELDAEKVKQLDDKEIEKLAVALNIVDNKNEFLKGVQTEVDKNKQNFLDKINTDETIGGTNVWKEIPSSNSKDFKTSLDKKIAYFQQLYDLEDDDVSKEKWKNKLDALNKLKDDEDLKKWEQTEKSLNYNFNKYQKIVDKYENPNNVYSQKAKDNAKWAKSMETAKKNYSSYANKVIQEWEAKDANAIKAIKEYTGSYSSINYPLRGKDYPHKSSYPEQSKQKQKEFLNRVENITKVLDTSTYDFNCWVQRGVGEINLGNKTLTYMAQQSELDELVGTSFKDQGFLSCGSHKGGGFSDKDLVMNIYCPKGTKMLYVPSISSYSSEDETIINRGYTYKITKAERKGGKVYLDCEVVLGSDENRYSKEQLKELTTKHF